MKSIIHPACVQRIRHCKYFRKQVFAIFAGFAASVVMMCAALAMPQSYAAPPSLIDVQDIDPSLTVDMAYRGSNNFLGRKVEGYRHDTCYLKDAAARALSAANNRLQSLDPPMKLVMRDCWRPTSASMDMVNWAQTTDSKNLRRDQLSETQQYIFQDSRLFQIIDGISFLRPSRLMNYGYLSAGYSKHNRGSVVDVELFTSRGGGWSQADTGTKFDTFSISSHFNASVGEEARTNRTQLANAMESEGFNVLSTEWWHWKHKSDGGDYLDGTN